MHPCAYVRIYVYVYVCTCVCVFVRECFLSCVCVGECVCSFLSVCMFVHACFSQCVCVCMCERAACEERSVEEQWSAMKLALCESAESALGMESKKRPDWFRESSSVLQPLMAERNRLYTKWLCSGNSSLTFLCRRDQLVSASTW